MKKVKIILGVNITLLVAAGATIVGLSIWANQSRGVRIHLDNSSYNEDL